MNKLKVSLLIFFTVLVSANALLYLFAYAGLADLSKAFPPQGPFSGLTAHFAARVQNGDMGFLAHVAGSLLALITGPFQFWQGLRQRRPMVHRALGYAYFIGVFVGGTGGLLSARNAWGGPVTQMGFGTLALAWLAASGQGLGAILKRNLAVHQSWMRLSYALTLAAVSLRIQMPLWLIAGLSDKAVYETIAWSCWLPQLWWWLAKGRKVGNA